MTIKFKDLKPWFYIDKRPRDESIFEVDGSYKTIILEQKLNEHLEYRKYNEKEINKCRQQLQMINQGRPATYWGKKKMKQIELNNINQALINIFEEWYESGDKPEDVLLGTPPHFKQGYAEYCKQREKEDELNRKN
jgi:hypothetical protein